MNNLSKKWIFQFSLLSIFLFQFKFCVIFKCSINVRELTQTSTMGSLSKKFNKSMKLPASLKVINHFDFSCSIIYWNSLPKNTHTHNGSGMGEKMFMKSFFIRFNLFSLKYFMQPHTSHRKRRVEREEYDRLFISPKRELLP